MLYSQNNSNNPTEKPAPDKVKDPEQSLVDLADLSLPDDERVNKMHHMYEDVLSGTSGVPSIISLANKDPI